MGSWCDLVHIPVWIRKDLRHRPASGLQVARDCRRRRRRRQGLLSHLQGTSDFLSHRRHRQSPQQYACTYACSCAGDEPRTYSMVFLSNSVVDKLKSRIPVLGADASSTTTTRPLPCNWPAVATDAGSRREFERRRRGVRSRPASSPARLSQTEGRSGVHKVSCASGSRRGMCWELIDVGYACVTLQVLHDAEAGDA